MAKYRLMRLSPWPIGAYVFIGSSCIGGTFGLWLGIAQEVAVGILGGLFLDFVFGLISSLLAVMYAGLFNVLAPSLGGITLELEQEQKVTPSSPPNSVTSPQDIQ